MTSIVWFRRDLRLEANPAWADATRSHDEVIGLFVVDPVVMETAAPARRAVLVDHLRALDGALTEYGGRLTVVTAGPGVGPTGVADAVRRVVDRHPSLGDPRQSGCCSLRHPQG